MGRMGEPESMAARRRQLGMKLATFRLAAGLTQAGLARLAFCDRTTIAHAEKGRARGDERFWTAVDHACQAIPRDPFQDCWQRPGTVTQDRVDHRLPGQTRLAAAKD